MPLVSGQSSRTNLSPAETIWFPWQSRAGCISTSAALARMRPLYPDSSKVPANTTVAYARRCRWRGKLKLLRSVSIPGVIQRKRELSIVRDTLSLRRIHKGKDSRICRLSVKSNGFKTCPHPLFILGAGHEALALVHFGAQGPTTQPCIF